MTQHSTTLISLCVTLHTCPSPSPVIQVRRLLLHAVLLCSAALDNQYEEVEYYLNQPYVSPNALGLRHKTALHLASIAGHVGIAQLLISRGVREGVDRGGEGHARGGGGASWLCFAQVC